MESATDLHAWWLELGHDDAFAVSAQTLEQMRVLVGRPNVKTIIEMGSGLTTVGLQLWRAEGQRVLTFEDDEKWLAHMRDDALPKMRRDAPAPGGRHIWVNAYVDAEAVRRELEIPESVDLAIHDGPSSPMMRPYYLQWLIGRFRPRMILIDDWHMEWLRKASWWILKGEGYDYANENERTEPDGFGRFSVVVERGR